LAPFDRAVRFAAVLAGCGESHGAFHLLGIALFAADGWGARPRPLAVRMGGGAGGIMNATFGNAAELDHCRDCASKAERRGQKRRLPARLSATFSRARAVDLVRRHKVQRARLIGLALAPRDLPLAARSR